VSTHRFADTLILLPHPENINGLFLQTTSVSDP
jgi:hypothetical protein